MPATHNHGQVQVYRNDAYTIGQFQNNPPCAVVISPGPGNEHDGGVSIDLISECATRGIPLLGVCLGHQILYSWCGGKTRQAKTPIHGKAWTLHHNSSTLFKHIPSPTTVARYHSLVADHTTLPDTLSVTAWTEEGEIMAISHKEYPFFGVQFHPESFLTDNGDALVKSFLKHAIRTSSHEHCAAA